MSSFDFRPELWRDRLDRMGEQIRWIRRMACPCVTPATGRPARDCPKCSGTGWLWEEQDVSAYRALITNQMPRQIFSSLGQFQLGDILCQTMPDEIPLAPRDAVILPSRWEEQSQTVERGDDTIRNWPVTELVSVQDLSTTYEVGVDCMVGADEKSISWITAGPAMGEFYSVRYRYSPTYDIIEMLPHRRKAVDGVRLPLAVSLRLRSLSQGQEVWS